MSEIWYTADEYKAEKQRGKLLGTVIVNALVNQGYVLQLDYKEDVESVKNYWGRRKAKLARFELPNDQYYYAMLPAKSALKNIYEVPIIYDSMGL